MYESEAVPILTVGHATRSLEQLVDLFETYGIRQVVDVRRRAHSKHSFHFRHEHLVRALPARGIGYSHVPELAGQQTPLAVDADSDALLPAHRKLSALVSMNAALTSRRLRTYADYMSTPAFAGAAESLQQQATLERTALLCAEPLPWRCHRQLLSDWLVTHGHDVWHLVGTDTIQHRLHPAARCMPDGSIIYPDADPTRLPS